MKTVGTNVQCVLISLFDIAFLSVPVPALNHRDLLLLKRLYSDDRNLFSISSAVMKGLTKKTNQSKNNNLREKRKQLTIPRRLRVKGRLAPVLSACHDARDSARLFVNDKASRRRRRMKRWWRRRQRRPLSLSLLYFIHDVRVRDAVDCG